MFDFIRPYFTIVKLYILGIVAVAVLGYIGWLHWTISSQQGQITTLQESVAVCEAESARLRTVNRDLNRTMDVWEAYYNERGCLDLSNDALKPDEMKIETK